MIMNAIGWQWSTAVKLLPDRCKIKIKIDLDFIEYITHARSYNEVYPSLKFELREEETKASMKIHKSLGKSNSREKDSTSKVVIDSRVMIFFPFPSRRLRRDWSLVNLFD